jgi:uncharacterized membrane protein
MTKTPDISGEPKQNTRWDWDTLRKVGNIGLVIPIVWIILYPDLLHIKVTAVNILLMLATLIIVITVRIVVNLRHRRRGEKGSEGSHTVNDHGKLTH